jgi:hypothetical protein
MIQGPRSGWKRIAPHLSAFFRKMEKVDGWNGKTKRLRL